jgi:hypothetical protein
VKDNFNFQSHRLANHDGNDLNEQVEQLSLNKESPIDEAKPKYNASADFFDSISNSTQVQARGAGGEGASQPVSGADIRRKDAQTFGYETS